MKKYLLIVSFVFLLVIGGSALAAPVWTFDNPEDIAAWSGMNQVNIVVENGLLKTESTGGDPYLYPGGSGGEVDWEPFDGSVYSTIYMRLKVNLAGDWQVYYITEEDGAWSELQHQNFALEASDDFVDVAVVMESGGWQEHTVTRFRLDAGTAVGVIAEIDYISLEGLVTPVESRGKLPALWSELKR